jgi:predicted DNA-binding transcriptional regulator YafY
MSKYERLARLMKIMTLIRTHRNMDRKHLAEEFGVSVRTIQRDINTLCYAGVPILWFDNGYKIVSDFFMPPVNLGVEEAFCLVIAARTFSEDKGKLWREKTESALSKIMAGLSNETRRLLEIALDKADSEGKDFNQLLHEMDNGISKPFDA